MMNEKKPDSKKFDKDLIDKSIKYIQNAEQSDEYPNHSGFIWQLFGFEARLEKNDYLQVIQVKCPWILDSTKIRARVDTYLDEKILDKLELAE